MVFAPLLLVLIQQAPPQPTFRTGVNVVEVDVVVTDKSGRPVRQLRQEDFELFEDGKPVEVATFSAVDLPDAPSGGAIGPADRSGSSFASNDQPDDGRVILIVLDDYHVSLDARRMVTAKSIARRLVERLGPSDQAAVVATSGRTSSQAEFTTDKARLVEAIDQFLPQSEQGAPGIAGMQSAGGPVGGRFGFVAELKTRWAMDTLNNAAQALATIPHRRKAVLLVSQGVPVGLEEMITNPHAGGAWQALRDFIVTAQRSNIAVYPVDPCALDLDVGCSNDSRENLRSIAHGTGGFAVTNTNAPETGVDRMVAENGAYYLIGYYSPAPSNDGKRHRIKVHTRVAGVQVRAREGYVSPRRGSKPVPAAAPLDALIGAPIQTRGLTMRVVAIPAPLGTHPSATVVVGIEMPAAQATRAARIAFSVLAIDSSGKSTARVRFSASFESRTGTPAGWARTGTRIDVPPGRYQIRVAAAGDDQSQGSVFTEVTVPKFGSDLGVGGLSLGLPTPLGAAGAGRLTGVLPLVPLAARDVLPSARAEAQVAIRTSAKAAAAPLSITATLARPDGTTLQLDQRSAPAREYSGASGQVYRIPLPDSLEAGAYRLTVEANLGRTAIKRELSFDVRAPQ